MRPSWIIGVVPVLLRVYMYCKRDLGDGNLFETT